jgi:hypothetical protein
MKTLARLLVLMTLPVVGVLASAVPAAADGGTVVPTQCGQFRLTTSCTGSLTECKQHGVYRICDTIVFTETVTQEGSSFQNNAPRDLVLSGSSSYTATTRSGVPVAVSPSSISFSYTVPNVQPGMQFPRLEQVAFATKDRCERSYAFSEVAGIGIVLSDGHLRCRS